METSRLSDTRSQTPVVADEIRLRIDAAGGSGLLLFVQSATPTAQWLRGGAVAGPRPARGGGARTPRPSPDPGGPLAIRSEQRTARRRPPASSRTDATQTGAFFRLIVRVTELSVA